MEAKQVAEMLGKAVDDNDFGAFNQHYLGFLKQFPAFEASYSKTPTDVPVTNAIFGQHGFYLKQTENAEAARMVNESRAASKIFGKLSVAERLEFLNILEEKTEKYSDAISLAITADTGKPMLIATKEMEKGKEWFDYARSQLEDQLGESAVGKYLTKNKPLGAAQVIGAYNYPYALAVGGMVGALGAGNGVIVSAPLKAPNWVFPFRKAADEAIEAFIAKAKEDGKSWADDLDKVKGGLITNSVGVNRNLTADADAVHFVGGDATGKAIYDSRSIGRRNGVEMHRRTVLEMGGSNVVAVMASAVETEGKDKEIAAKIFSGFGPATGQRCTAPRILCVEEGAEGVIRELSDIADRGMSPNEIGNPFKDGVIMGPLVDKGAHQRMEAAIELAHKLGAEVHGELRVGDNIVPQARAEGSYWVNPIVIDWSKVDLSHGDNAKQVHDCLKEEIFGPLIHIVHKVKDLDEAIATTNKYDSHGLAGAIFTARQEDADRYIQETNITSISVNEIPKDLSPGGKHGHPGLPKIGGNTHFLLYSDEISRQGGITR